MGCGKTTLGRGLAKSIGYDFIDLDRFIENKNFKTIAQIFENYGEAGFREKEGMALEEVCEYSNIVLATGGGTPCFGRNMELMNDRGLTVFINISPQELASRLIKSKTPRPLINGLNEKDILHFVNKKLDERRTFYEQAQIAIEHNSPKVQMLIDAINEQYN